MLRKLLPVLLIIPCAVAIALPARILFHTETFKLDISASKIEWFAEKLTGKHNGIISPLSGELHNNHGKFTGKFVMDMNSIAVSDLPAERRGKLENHLKSEDFFNAKSFPVSTFEITSISPISGAAGEPNFNITGNLTIKGITHEITFPAILSFEGKFMTASGTLTIDRSKFDVKYGSKTFFEDIGDRVIYDDFKLQFQIKATI